MTSTTAYCQRLGERHNLPHCRCYHPTCDNRCKFNRNASTGVEEQPMPTPSKPRIYLAGPMTGLPDNNYPAFNDAADKLRAMGYAVENPAENPEPDCKSWAGYMRLALRQLVYCDAVVLLPGWIKSRGANVEYYIARILGMGICRLDEILEDEAKARKENI